jgi:hypothetical protein
VRVCQRWGKPEGNVSGEPGYAQNVAAIAADGAGLCNFIAVHLQILNGVPVLFQRHRSQSGIRLMEGIYDRRRQQQAHEGNKAG